MSNSWHPNLRSPDTTTQSLEISNIAYMNDTTLILNSQENLNSLLKITDSFNHLNNILTNDDKGILITTANPSYILYSTPYNPNFLTS
ncbi:3005_t:CDS:1, partial [Funneliformis geosporum]